MQLVKAFTWCLACIVIPSAYGQPAAVQNWPVKPVRIIAPFALGGSADTLGRIVAVKLTETFGQNFVVENRGGAGGLVGADGVTRAAPDGYAFVVSGLGPLVI